MQFPSTMGFPDTSCTTPLKTISEKVISKAPLIHLLIDIFILRWPRCYHTWRAWRAVSSTQKTCGVKSRFWRIYNNTKVNLLVLNCLMLKFNEHSLYSKHLCTYALWMVNIWPFQYLISNRLRIFYFLDKIWLDPNNVSIYWYPNNVSIYILYRLWIFCIYKIFLHGVICV